MATTTNYSWTTPDDTDLVKDGAAAIRTLGSAIDTSFAANEGDLLLGGTSDIFEPLAIGAADTVLTSDGTTASWAAPAGGGKVLQVVGAVTTTSTTIATTSYTDTTITATITPTSATSKIMVFVNGYAFMTRASSGQAIGLKLVRSATDIYTNTYAFYPSLSGVTSMDFSKFYPVMYLDSPATTSATTYKIQARIFQTSNSGSSTWQSDGFGSTITLMEIGA